MKPWAPLLVAAGWLSLLLGIIGVFLPVLPTTPFVLLAAYCFSKGSPRAHRWLLRQKGFGPLIRDWEAHGVVSLRAKWLATAGILGLFGYTLGWVPVAVWIKTLVAAIGLGTLSFLWTRPSHR